MALSTAELAQIRSDIGELFPDTGYILSCVHDTGDDGSPTETWSTDGTASCRVDYKSGKQVLTGAAIVPYQKAVISMEYDEEITTANRVTVGDYTFSIEAVNVGQSWIGVKRITAEVIP